MNASLYDAFTINGALRCSGTYVQRDFFCKCFSSPFGTWPALYFWETSTLAEVSMLCAPQRCRCLPVPRSWRPDRSRGDFYILFCIKVKRYIYKWPNFFWWLVLEYSAFVFSLFSCFSEDAGWLYKVKHLGSLAVVLGVGNPLFKLVIRVRVLTSSTDCRKSYKSYPTHEIIENDVRAKECGLIKRARACPTHTADLPGWIPAVLNCGAH